MPGDQSPGGGVLPHLLFKLFNKIETWELSWTHSARSDDEFLAGTCRSGPDPAAGGETVYSAAYIMPSGPRSGPNEAPNHLRLIERMMRDRLPSGQPMPGRCECGFESHPGYPVDRRLPGLPVRDRRELQLAVTTSRRWSSWSPARAPATVSGSASPTRAA